MMFFDKKCTITRITVQVVDAEERKVSTVLYESIGCDFFRYGAGRNKYSETDAARESLDGAYEVTISASKSGVTIGDHVELIDPTAGSQGTYLISEVTPYRLPSGRVDFISLICSKINA